MAWKKILAAAVLASVLPLAGAAEDRGDEVVHVSNSDATMNAAIKEARRTLPDFLKLDGGPRLPSDERGYAFGDPVLSAPGIFAMGDPLSTDEVEAATSVAELFGPDFVPADPETWQRTVSRNTLCPCGSGRKFKHCHGLAE